MPSSLPLSPCRQLINWSLLPDPDRSRAGLEDKLQSCKREPTHGVPSPQLAIFAASPVDVGMDDGFIPLPLASDARAYTWQCFAPTRGDFFPAVFTMF